MSSNLQAVIGDFQIDDMMRYSLFVPRLYNLCKSPGFEPGKIMPSRAFCSDENQGCPIILITKHFGTFPFNHGMVGGVVATDRHGTTPNMARTWLSSGQATSAMIHGRKISAPITHAALNNAPSVSCGKIGHTIG